MVFHIDKIDPILGFATGYTAEGGVAQIITRASLASDESDFHIYIEKFSAMFLARFNILPDQVSHFLAVIHGDSSADIYVNDVMVTAKIRAKRSVEAGTFMTADKIVDVVRLRFPNIDISNDDKFVFCFKVAWRFGLYFDLTPGSYPDAPDGNPVLHTLDIDEMELSLGRLHSRLLFNNVYASVDSSPAYQTMLAQGWFPFIEMIPYEYDSMIQAYESSSNLPEQIDLVLEKFDDDRISGLVEKWWSSPVFADKKELIEAGIAAYQMGTSGGYILCIKTLISEIEGLMRTVYFEDTGKGNHVKSPSLVQHVTEKGAENAGTSQSLLLPEQFRDYLDSIVFANFNVETGEVDLSRNTVGHGVADAEQYTKSRALQMILILDQLYFYN